MKLQKNIRDQFNTFGDILKYHGLTQQQFNKNNKGLTPDEIGYRKEKLIVAAYNQGDLPNWDDGTYKYWPVFTMSSSGFRFHGYDDWATVSDVGSRLCFCGDNAYENMKDAVSKFLPEYKESRTT